MPTIREAINAGKYFRMEMKTWQSGGFDIDADSPELAALTFGAVCQQHRIDPPQTVRVLRHLKPSLIGLACLEECGVLPTLTADHYDI